MRYFFSYLFSAFFLISCSDENPEQNVTPPQEPAVEVVDHLGQAIAKFGRAYQEADVNTLSEMVTEQYVHSNDGGPIIRKDEWLDWVASRRQMMVDSTLTVYQYFYEDMVIETYGYAAVVHGEVVSRGFENGEPFEKRNVCTHTWVRENDRWQRASFHDSKVE